MADPSELLQGRTEGEIINIVGQKAIRIAELEQENALLRAAEEATRTASAKELDRIQRERDELVRRYSELERRYNKLSQKHSECTPHIRRADEKYRAAKESARQWKAYINRHKSIASPTRDAVPGEASRLSPAVAILRRPDVAVPLHEDGPAPQELRQIAPIELGRSGGETAPPASKNLPVEVPIELGPSEGPDLPTSAAPPVHSSQTTESEQLTESEVASPRQIKLEASSDDEPEVVSARSLKRRRGNQTHAAPRVVRIKQEPNSPTNQVLLVSEDYSSPKSKKATLRHAETSDLDAIVGNPITPRKNRQNEAIDTRATVPGAEELLLPQKSPPSHPDVTNDDRTIREEDDKSTAPASSGGDGAHPGVAVADFASNRQSSEGKPLRPVSVNIPHGHRVRKVTAEDKRARRDRRTPNLVAQVAEDGEHRSSEAYRPTTTTTLEPPPKTQLSHHRLDALLDKPTPKRQPLPKRDTPRTHEGHQHQHQHQRQRQHHHHHNSPTPRQTGPTAEATSAKTHTPNDSKVRTAPASHHAGSSSGIVKGSPPAAAATAAIQAEEEQQQQEAGKKKRLRSLTLDELAPDDFRVDPRYMGGAGFAFADPVRGRTARRGLQACTRAECCGDTFRRAVEMTRPSATATRGVEGDGDNDNDNDNDNNYNDDDDDVAALAALWCGGDRERAARLLAATPAHRRAEVVRQARVQALADRVGRHRHAFERRRTPPGFWRTDMPTTQEEEEDRARAGEVERRVVEERWGDAMRGGGRWKFRDE